MNLTHSACRRGAATLMTCMLTATATMAVAQDFPSQPITLVVGFPPGGGSDLMGRIVAEAMTEELGQPVIVENRPGASGSVGLAYVQNAEPDGYIIGMSGVGTSVVREAVGQNDGYTFAEDFVHLGQIATQGMLVAARKDLGVEDFSDLAAYVKENPGEVAYGTSGVTSPGYIGFQSLLSQNGLDMLHIPYKGTTPLMNDLLGGHLDVGLVGIPQGTEQTKAGEMLSLGVTGTDRSSVAPDVKTIGEDGFDGFAIDLFNIVVGPKGLPEDRAEALSDALFAAVNNPDVQAQFAKLGYTPSPMKMAEVPAFLQKQNELWDNMVAASSGAGN